MRRHGVAGKKPNIRDVRGAVPLYFATVSGRLSKLLNHS